MHHIPESITTLGEALRWACEQNNMTMRALAHKLDVSPPFLSDVQHGRRNLVEDKIELAARILDVPVKELLEKRLCESAEEWRKKHPQLAKLLDELSRKKNRCYCPWCRRLPEEDRNYKP